MKVDNRYYRSVWIEGTTVHLIEQNKLPFNFRIYRAKTYIETCSAIKDMKIRGAGAIGSAAAFAMAQAAHEAQKEIYQENIDQARKIIENTRPTAYDLFYAVERVYEKACISPAAAMKQAQALANANAEAGKMIGQYGNKLLKDGTRILTHCNAGWIAFVDYGSALAPVYIAQQEGKNVFVYVDETRPRSQGARLTAWELKNQGVNHAIIPDNAAAHYMSQNKIDILITGADRIAANGDVANKIGTLEKAIAAKYYGIPFYVAAPISTFDPNTPDGNHINIEQRSENEVHYASGPDSEQIMHKIRISNPESDALNPAFDVTPASLIKGIITEKGIIDSTTSGLATFLNKVC